MREHYIGNPNQAFTIDLINRNVVKIIHEYTDGFQKYEILKQAVFDEMYRIHFVDE